MPRPLRIEFEGAFYYITARVWRNADERNYDIARYFGVGYTAVSQAVLRLKKEMAEDKRLKMTVESLEKELSEK
jgi:hypothetical protein